VHHLHLLSQPGGRTADAPSVKGGFAVPAHASAAPPDQRLDEFIDGRPVGRFHVLVLALTGSVMFLDGLDTQAISFIAPAVAGEWGLPVAALGPIFSASIAGLMIGYLVIAPLATRLGHRTVVIVATALFGLVTIACAAAADGTQLLVLRLLTGVGLGAVIPSAVGLASEFAPARRRSTFVMIIYCWLAAGFVAASLVSGAIIPAWGWRTVFVLAGGLPLVLVLILLRYLPESPSYLVTRRPERAHATLRRLDPRLQPHSRLVVGDVRNDADRRTLVELFRRHWLLSTGLLWLAFMLNLAVFYAVQSWLPTILGRLGQPASVSITATALTTVGGIVAAFFIGPMMDRRGPFATLAVVYLLGAVFMTGFAGAVSGASSRLLLVAAFLAGTCVTGGQMSVIALAAVLYPPRIRSVGVGWALGIGRVGGIVGPLAVGSALGAGHPPRAVFLAMAAGLLVAAAAVVALARTSRSVRRLPAEPDPRPRR
jgi:AAHS family 4-hydroxybenzoate transporter-like MFS transporter